VIIGALAFVAYGYLALVREPTNAILGLLSDDAFYYLQIARNITEGHGPTFDRIAPTNGFHPLWMGSVVLLSWCTRADSHLTALAVLALNGLLAATTLVLLDRLVQRFIAPGLGLVAVAICLLPNVLWALLNGLETGLLVFSATALLWFCYANRIHEVGASGPAGFAFGTLLGAVALSRLDAVFLLAAAAILNGICALLERAPARRWFSRATAVGLGFALLFGPYVAWNLWAFGHLMPISGAVKSSFPYAQASTDVSGDILLGLGVLACLVPLEVIRWTWSGRPIAARFSSPLLLLCASCVLHFLHTWLFMTWGVYWWHFTLYGLALSLVFTEVAARALSRLPLRPRGILFAAFAGILVASSAFLSAQVLPTKADQHRGWLEAAEWAEQNLGNHAIIAIKDAGLFGYFSGRRVVNLDGKANGYAYLDHLRSERVEEYLTRVGVSFVADVHGNLPIAIPRAAADTYFLELPHASLLYRGSAIPSDLRDLRPKSSHFSIWRLAAEPGQG
jgi:hypothetical protein